MSQAGRQAVGKRWGEARERTAKAHKVHPQHCCIKPQSDMTSELGHCMNDPPQVHTSSKEFQGPRHKLGLKCASPQTWPCRGREGGSSTVLQNWLPEFCLLCCKFLVPEKLSGNSAFLISTEATSAANSLVGVQIIGLLPSVTLTYSRQSGSPCVNSEVASELCP